MAQSGTANNYPSSECTWWADERYHTLTGYFVPWSANAGDWARIAPSYGWTVSSTPVAPSICCLAPGIQEASAQYGHVCIVEKILTSGVVETSNLNWGANPTQVTTVHHSPGAGVSFIYVQGKGGKPLAQFATGFIETTKTIMGASPIQLAPNADVQAYLYYLDELLKVTNPFDISLPTQSIGGFKFQDPFAWLSQFGTNVQEDSLALIWRLVFLFLGAFLIYKVLSNYVDFGAIAQNGQQIAGPLLEALAA